MNILVLTSEYPGNFKDPNNNITPVVHYFAREWVKQGHSVIVIHNAHRFPYIIHALPKKIKDDFTLKHGFSIMGTDYIKKDAFELDGVRVWRLPIVKFIPHGDHSRFEIKKHARRIEIILKKINFTPEIIIGHWASPQMQLIKELKPVFECKTALTLHDLTYLKGKNFNFKEYIDAVDMLGFRNRADEAKAKIIIGNNIKTYICYSGIPYNLINQTLSYKKFEDKELKIIYVGRLIERKKIDIVIEALHNSGINNYIFDIVGSGPQEAALKSKVKELGEEEKVIFHGRLDRKEIFDLYNKAQLFIMVSRGEAFGLVYLEAMASKCIPIGSYGEGIDGIVQNNENGYLCNPGNETELCALLNIYAKETTDVKKTIARKAFETACKYTDPMVAEDYLRTIIANQTKGN